MNSSYPKLAAILLLASVAGAQAADPVTAEMVPTICGGCHGPDGVNDTPAIPNIAGQPADYLRYALLAYASGEWSSVIVATILSHYSLSDAEVMVEFYAARPYVGIKQEVDPRKVEVGKKIHYQLCDNCHMEGGLAPDEYEPILAGQWMPYMRHAIELYRTGQRPQVPMMATKIAKLSDEGVEALVHYYGSHAFKRDPDGKITLE